MNIGLDYDDTYTRDPAMWNSCLALMRAGGHKIYVVTWRTQSECECLYEILDGHVHGVYATSRKAKEKYMYSQGIRIDVWIDDNPHAILHTMEGWE